MYNGLAKGNKDAVESEGKSMDGCMSHGNPRHTHSLSPCTNHGGVSAGGSTTVKPKDCADSGSNCLGKDNENIRAHWNKDDAPHGGVYGLGKDGHVIYGPFNKDGEVWTCEDVDMCNGFFLADGSYGYASTSFFPYYVGCWGPASAAHEYMPSCTSSGCGVAAATSSMSFSALTIAAIAINSIF